MTKDQVIEAMADTALASEGVSYDGDHRQYGHQWADERARQWWIDHHRRALEVAEANGWTLTNMVSK